MPAGTLSVMLTSDHSDVRPGDQVFFTVIVRNVSTVPAVQVKAVDSFSPAQLRVVASDGQAYLNHVDWLIRSIQPDQKVTLRLKMRVADSVAMDEVIHTSVVLMQGGVMQPSVGNADLHVTQALPQTGAEHTGPLEDTSRYLSPL